MAASTTLTKEQLVQRARKAALARTTVEAHIAALVAAAPELTDEQAALLRGLLGAK